MILKGMNPVRMLFQNGEYQEIQKNRQTVYRQQRYTDKKGGNKRYGQHDPLIAQAIRQQLIDAKRQ